MEISITRHNGSNIYLCQCNNSLMEVFSSPYTDLKANTIWVGCKNCNTVYEVKFHPISWEIEKIEKSFNYRRFKLFTLIKEIEIDFSCVNCQMELTKREKSLKSILNNGISNLQLYCKKCKAHYNCDIDIENGTITSFGYVS